ADSTWEFAGRLFKHPAMRPEIQAPYEQEMNQLGEKVYNLWGQRVTALIPHREGLLASTSNKNGSPSEPRLTFLKGGRDREYGEVYRLYLAGHLTAPMVWTGAPIELEFEITPGGMAVSQNGQRLGTANFPPASMDGFAIDQVRWGDGVFGPLQGRLSAESLETLASE
ncbi:MAG TPA: hypothetical protein PLD73_06285, partial [Candidatus Hydrogenedentes bacterium]|nr:hypothetical protein [Candidatus Hydrogenedentota bacterium]